MAQAVAALAGVRARTQGEPVKIGFLVGTRRYVSRWPRFLLGSRLRIHVRQDFEAGNGLSVFACRIAPRRRGSCRRRSERVPTCRSDRVPGGRGSMKRTVLVTGSSRGIGRACALRLARDGFDIVLHCRRRREDAEQIAGEIAAAGREVRILQFDVSDRAEHGRR